MIALQPQNALARHSWLAALLLLATAAASLAAPPESGDSDPDDAPDTGFKASGEIREVDDGALIIRPWQPRLPARFRVKSNSRTRVVRQKPGRRSDLTVGELVLVVEEPPNKDEKLERQRASEARKKSKTKATPVRAARARAVLRCWKADPSETTPENRQIARALLEGARPYFKGEAYGGVRAPGDSNRFVFGMVTRLEPFTLRAAKRVVEYSVTGDTLVLNHQRVSLSTLKRGENVLVQSSEAPATDGAVEAAVIAVTPRPRLKLDQQRRLILRDRRSPEGEK